MKSLQGIVLPAHQGEFDKYFMKNELLESTSQKSLNGAADFLFNIGTELQIEKIGSLAAEISCHLVATD